MLTDRGDWADATDQRLVCRAVEQVARDVKTFVFESVQGRLFLHDPGQYLSVTVDVDGAEVNRCYTLSSPPSRPHRAAITVKREPGGLVSNWLHQHLDVGMVVQAQGPFGEFSVEHHPAASYLFLSGGSGATPMMSMVRTLVDLARAADVVFVHSARTPDDILFRAELALIEAHSDRVRVAHICEDDGRTERWRGHRGRLDLATLREIAPDLLEREVFSCGPPAYMAAVRRMVREAGLPASRLHEESFTIDDGLAAPAVAPPPEEPATQPAATAFRVELSRTGRTIECDADTPVLQAAARHGVTLPSSCGQGLCGTCVARLDKGTVEMPDNGGLRPRDKLEHKILLCCSRPLEDLVIDA